MGSEEMPYQDIDLSFLDQPEILQFIFYPRKDLHFEPQMPNATNYFIEVEKEIRIVCRLYVAKPDSPTLLYFHGNGETIGDYDYIAPFYNQRNINLFVADYRGYGLSEGEPTCTNMIRDAHPIFKSFYEIIDGYKRDVFVMGRSIGSAPAIELAFHYQQEMKGLIIESGFAGSSSLLDYLGIPAGDITWEERGFANGAKIRSVHIPTLVIHGEYDRLIPLVEGRKLYENVPAKNKRFVAIPGADHNSLILAGADYYFQAIEEFVKAGGG